MSETATETPPSLGLHYIALLISAVFHAAVFSFAIAATTIVASMAYVGYHYFMDPSAPIGLPFAIAILVGAYVGINVFRAELAGSEVVEKHRRLVITMSVIYWNLALMVSLGLAIMLAGLTGNPLVYPMVGLGYALLEIRLASHKLSVPAWATIAIVFVGAFVLAVLRKNDKMVDDTRDEAVVLMRDQPSRIVQGMPHPAHVRF